MHHGCVRPILHHGQDKTLTGSSDPTAAAPPSVINRRQRYSRLGATPRRRATDDTRSHLHEKVRRLAKPRGSYRDEARGSWEGSIDGEDTCGLFLIFADFFGAPPGAAHVRARKKKVPTSIRKGA